MSVASVEPRVIVSRRGLSDRIFRGIVSSGALFSLVVLALIAGFLWYRGFEIFREFGLSFLTTSDWVNASEDGSVKAQYGIAAMLLGSIVVATIAIVIAVPFAMAVSLFLEYYAPSFIRRPLTSVLDLVAAVPSVIWGLWGYSVLQPQAIGWSKSLNSWFDWIPIFKVPAPIFDRSPFIAGLLLSMMILPITTAVTREVYGQAPRDQIDAVYGLGGTRWGAMRTVVMPFGRSGLVGGAMLGLGRALGETIAVFLLLNLVFKVNFQILASAGGNVASLIANRYGEATPYELKALMAAGFVLFVVTLLVNFAASAVVDRSKAN